MSAPLEKYIERFFSAAAEGNVEIITTLIKGIPNIDTRNEKGWTALMFASRHGQVAVVKFLLEKGADKTLINSSGQNSLDIAKFWNQTEIEKMMQDKAGHSPWSNIRNFLGNNSLDRAAHKRKDDIWISTTMKSARTKYILFSDLNVLAIQSPNNSVNSKMPSYRIYDVKYDTIIGHLQTDPLVIFLGMETDEKGEASEDSVSWFAVDVSTYTDEDFKKIHPQAELLSAYPGLTQITEPQASICGQARSVLAWHDRYKFCPTCGSSTIVMEAGYKRKCSSEDCRSLQGIHNTSYPRLDPTVIMAVVHPDGKQILLGRGKRFPKNMYSCLAGFIEQGEIIEDACRRETFEESGIRVGRVEYHSSQPWPMPCSLMIGCMAYAETSQIQVDKDELEDAKWFSRQDVIQMLIRKHPDAYFCPPEQAIAHILIKSFVNMTSNL